MATRRTTAALVFALSLVAVAAGCGSRVDRATGSSATVLPAPIDYAERGPYPVGTTTLRLGDRDAVVLYPADEGAVRAHDVVRVAGFQAADLVVPAVRPLIPADLDPRVLIQAYRDVRVNAEGPFPLVLYSHGLEGYALDIARQLEHLASWGFIVAAPEHTERDLGAVLAGTVDGSGDPDLRDLRSVLRRMRHENTTQNGLFQAAVDLEHIATLGQGEGARAAALMAADPAITTWIGQAPTQLLPLPVVPGAPEPTAGELASLLASVTPPQKPSMLLAADGDRVAPLANVRAQYAWLPAPKRLAVLAHAGHRTFASTCGSVRARGGLSALAEPLDVGPELLARLEDGCLPGGLEPAAALAVVDHLHVAQLRHVFGFDPSDASLQPAYVERRFPGTLAEYRSQP